MSSDPVSVTVTGPEPKVTSSRVVLNSAAMEIRVPALFFGFLAGCVAVLAFLIMSDSIVFKTPPKSPPEISEPAPRTPAGPSFPTPAPLTLPPPPSERPHVSLSPTPGASTEGHDPSPSAPTAALQRGSAFREDDPMISRMQGN